MIPLVSYSSGIRAVIGNAEVKDDEVRLYSGKTYLGISIVDEPTKTYLQKNPTEVNAYDVAPFFLRGVR